MIVLLSRLYELLYASEAIASYEYTVKATTIYRQGAMLAPIRLTNAAAQLVLRTQVRRKETHPHHPSAPLPPLRGSSITSHKSVSKAQPAGVLATTRLVHLVLSGTSISRKRDGSVIGTVMFPSLCIGKSSAGDHWPLAVSPKFVLAVVGNLPASLA